MPASTPVAAGERRLLAIILAAGEGTRMKSTTPKVLHQVGGLSMLGHVLTAAQKIGATHIAAVIGPGRDDVAAEVARLAPGADVFVQTERRGTAHAVLAARAALERGFDDVLIAFADTPNVAPETFSRLRAPLAAGAAVAALGFETADPTGYGRLVTGPAGLERIVEHKDATEAERRITLCNAGLMAIDGRKAISLLEAVGNANAQGEFYLPDVVGLACAQGGTAAVVTAAEDEVQGVNDRVQLAVAEAVFQTRMRRAAMVSGVTLIAPETVFFSHDTVLGRDVVVEPHVVFGPKVTVADQVVIHAFSHLEGATLASGASIGPYARLRPGAVLEAGARVGNFVEIKAATLGAGAKVNHLTYIGDASIGPKANIGAGTITCNYDGFNKSKTVIGAGAFIGSNSSLVAPVSIGDGAYVGSGTVVTKDVPADALSLARAPQANKEGWAPRFRAAAAARKAAKTKG